MNEKSRRTRAFRFLLAATLTMISVAAVQTFSSGCSSRSDATWAADSTRVYQSKDPGGVEASIVFCSKSPSKKTGRRRGIGDVFTAGEKSRIYAFVDLENPFALGQRPLEFHLVWIAPDGKSFYKKRVEYMPTDSTRTIGTRISIPPERRSPGEYALRVYFFRELIAEKGFEIRHGDVESSPSS